MTTDELNAIVKAVMDELEKAGVDFDFKAEVPQADDLVYVMRGTADTYKGITVKWQNLLDIIVKKATDAKDEAVSAKDIALQTLATIQGIESNVSSMKSSVDASEANVSSMKVSVEGTKTEVENIKEETAGLIDTKVSYTDALTYEEIMASTDLTNKVASASALKHLKPITGALRVKDVAFDTTLAYLEGANVTIPANCIFGINSYVEWANARPTLIMLSTASSSNHPNNLVSTSSNGSDGRLNCSYVGFTSSATSFYVWAKTDSGSSTTNVYINYWYIQL